MSQEPAAADVTVDRGPVKMVTALGLAVLIGVATFVLTSDGSDVVTAPAIADTAVATETPAVETERAPAATAPTTTIPPEQATSLPAEPAAPEQPPEDGDLVLEETAEGFFGSPAALGGGDAESSMPAFLAGEITNMGPTEIGYVTNFASVNYRWDRIEIPGPGLSESGWMGELDGRMVAVSAGMSDGAQALVTHSSDDGLAWEQAGSFAIPDDVWIVRIVGDGQKVFAVGQGQEFAREPRYVAYSTVDGVTWTTAEIPIDLDEDENAYIQSVVAGPAGLALAIGLDTYPGEPPVVLTFDDYEVTLNHMRSTYTLAEIESGEVVLTGTLDDLYNWGDDGQTVYNPETGEILTVIPWEVWEQGWGGPYGRYGSSPLPIPVGGDEPQGSSTVIIEYDGYVISIDDFSGEFTVAEADSGEEIVSGTLDELYQGPAPEFVDPETGEVLLTVTWDEWHRAEELGWQNVEYGDEGFFYRSRTGLMTSPDGDNWATEIVSEGSGGASAYLAATDDGFIAMINSYGEFGEHGEVWTMVDGVWSSEPSQRTDLWLRSLVTTSSGLVGVGEGSGGPALWSSPDGVSWSSEFAIVPQDDGTYAYLASVAAEPGAIAALAVRERWSGHQPLEIVQDQYTASFEEGEALVAVRETDSGEQVLVLTWEDADSGLVAELITWADGATSIELGNGDVMVISDEEAIAAMDDIYSGLNQIGLSVFLDDGSGWTEAVVDVEGEISGAAQLAMVDGRIFIGGSYWGEGGYYRDGPAEDTLVLVVGTPAGG